MTRARNGEPIAYLQTTIDQAHEDCVPWPFATGQNGRPTAAFRGKMGSAARAACILFNGPPPSPRHEAAHNCGNAACVNARHLRWATPSENQRDRILHGTSNRGERNGQTELTVAQVREIRSLDGTVKNTEIAKRFGITTSAVTSILLGKTWGWLDEDKWHPVRRRSGRNTLAVTLRGETIPLSKACRDFGFPYNKIKCRILDGWSDEEAFEFVRRATYGSRIDLKAVPS
jgi:HNH endonuclease